MPIEKHEELRSCPFCGGEGVLHGKINSYHVECHNDSKCSVLPISHTYGSESGAISAWNTRAPSQADAKLDAVRETLGELEPATIETDDGDFEHYNLEATDKWLDKLREIVNDPALHSAEKIESKNPPAPQRARRGSVRHDG